MKVFKIYLILFLIAALFSGCKKYPENKLWFKDPKTTFKGGKITSYTKNGIDQMPYYRNLYSTFPYNYLGHSVDDIFATSFEYNSGDQIIKNEYGKGGFRFSEKKKDIEISFTPVNSDYGAESILVERMSWKILKLTKDGVLKLRAKYNFNTYEIQFN
jgi:hypothetical protein